MPSLRERKEDIIQLANHFLKHFSRTFRKNFERLSPGAERMLMAYAWPGNIRELKNVFERTVLLEEGPVVEEVHLERAFAPRKNSDEGPRQPGDRAPGAGADGALDPRAGIEFETIVEGIERALIMRASEATGWNQSRTAQLLNLKRDKLRYRMKIYSIHHGETGPDRELPAA